MSKIFLIFFILNGAFSGAEELSLSQKTARMNLAFKTKSRNGFARWAFQVLEEDEKNFNALNKLGVYHLDRGQFVLARIIFETGFKKNIQKNQSFTII